MAHGVRQVPVTAGPNSELDGDALRHEIQAEYSLVANEPTRSFHFHTGRPLARLLGNTEECLAGSR